MNEEDSEQTRRASASARLYISRRPRSEAEVRAHLRRNYPADVVEQVIRDLCEQSLIDDAKFAELWASSRLNNKPRSAWMVRRELQRKGIPDEIADGAVSDFNDAHNAYRTASAYARRLGNADYETFHRRLYGYMGRRGFGASVSRQVISRLWQSRTGDCAESDAPYDAMDDGCYDSRF